MMDSIHTIEASTQANTGRHAILVTRWNSFITDNLLNGALKALRNNQIDDKNITIVRVPGAVELPLTAQKIAETGYYQSIIALGAVIRGGTPHFEYVCAECSNGLGQVQRQTGVPITFGVLTVDNVEQALERCDDNANNKGYEAAVTALEMANLMAMID